MSSHFRRDYALVVLLALGIAANVGAMRLAKGRTFTIPPPAPLPTAFHGWKGQMLPEDKGTQAILPHARITSVYYEQPDTIPIYTVVVASRDPNDLHTPERCFTGSGWEISGRGEVPLQVDGPHPGSWKFNRMVVRSSGQEEMVLYGYDGVRMIGGSTVWARAAMKLSGPTANPAYFIRLSSATGGNIPAAEARLMEFATHLMRERAAWQTPGKL